MAFLRNLTANTWPAIVRGPIVLSDKCALPVAQHLISQKIRTCDQSDNNNNNSSTSNSNNQSRLFPKRTTSLLFVQIITYSKDEECNGKKNSGAPLRSIPKNRQVWFAISL